MPVYSVTIIKDGKLINIDEKNLLQDDLVVLQAGDMVPADLKLVEARSLEVDEFYITGEIMPVIKRVEGEDDILFKGSRVIRGVAKGIVIATGEQTEYGKVLQQEMEGHKPSAYQIFNTKYLGLVLLLLPALIVHLTRFDQDALVVMLYIGSSILLVLLQNDPLFYSILVAKEIKRLGFFNIQIRDVDALARMHKINLLCFDKTGVLTTQHMEVKAIFFTDMQINAKDELGDGSSIEVFPIVKMACALCNDIQFYKKIDLADPVDKAFIFFAMIKDMDVEEMLSQYRRVYDFPFDSENRYMVSGFERDGQEVYFLKGDPDVVMNMCNYYVTSTGARKKIDWEYWRFNRSSIDVISHHGDTAIAIAYTTEVSEKNLPDLYSWDYLN